MPTYDWGIDSARIATEELLTCVIDNFGHPKFWGRYLLTIPNISQGLTAQEIAFIRSNDIKILPIYNRIFDAMTYSVGVANAIDAISSAQRLGIPRDVPLFADIEPFFSVDSEWVEGWTETISSSGYRSGIYNSPLIGDFSNAFCEAAERNETVRTFNILWSAQPVADPSGPENPPEYKPASVECGGNVLAWQYSRDLAECPIDTNLADSTLTEMLW
ncbi:MAG: DUF1906 domain-containing protein [Eubacteriales bacterium]|nr:DUF1906 domain-containing protein [Eubacteriales bacterium]MDD4389995.1 DUF1906 domain-containing protein [Eubacteriales bacterium]